MAPASIAPAADPDRVLAGMTDFERLRIHKLLLEKKALKIRNGVAFYRPHEKQALFHACGARYRFIRVSNRWGKSICGAAEDVAWLLGERPWVPEGLPERTLGIPPRPVKGCLICVDWDKSAELFTAQEGDEDARGLLFRLLPHDNIASVCKNHSGNVSQVFVKGKYGTSVLYIDTVQSYKANPMGHESSAWDFLHIDEPLPQGMWQAYARGLIDRGGSAWFCCTLLNEGWINDMFLPTQRDEHVSEVVANGDKWTITGSMYDNPYLKPEHIKEFEDSLTEDERQCRIYGIPMSMSGTIYKGFQPFRHVYRTIPRGWKNYNDPPLDYTIRFAVDPHPRTPHAVLFAATAPTGEVFFYDEIFKSGTIDEIAIQIKLKLHNRNVLWGLCDPLGFIESPIDGRAMVDVFVEHGIVLDKAPKDPSNGILQVTEALKEPDLLHFSCNLTRTLWEFDHYVWDEKRADRPKDKDDHFMECLYRLVLTGLDYVSQEENERIIIPFAGLDTTLKLSGDGAERHKRRAFLARYR